jgi:hypothetical protein
LAGTVDRAEIERGIMSKNIRGIPVIFEEAPDICEQCGAFEELRPYGKDGKRICFKCAEKDPNTTEREMNKRLFGDDPVQ